MSHLIATLLHVKHLSILVLVLLCALLGSIVATRMLSGTGRTWTRAAAFAIVTTLCGWLSFRIAFLAIFPRLAFSVPAGAASFATAILLFSAFGGAAIQVRGRRSARNALVAGSLLSCGFSCMLFTAMAGLVSPFQLAYDLVAVLATMILGAALFAFALRESTAGLPADLRLSDGRPLLTALLAPMLMAMAFAGLALGSLASILPFGSWMATLGKSDDLASSPVAIIAAAEALAMLALGLSGSLVDNRVAARDRLEADRLRQLADSTLEGILIHRDGRVLDANVSMASLLGLTLAELRTSAVHRFIPPGGNEAVWNASPDAALKEVDIMAADGTLLPVEILSRSIDHGGRPALVTALRDVRERRASERRIRFLAHHDMLTELPNRVLLQETLDMALRLSARRDEPLAVLCLDLDGFKAVNDTLGHQAGDLLLRLVAARLRRNLRETDFVARVGGDEFVVVQTTDAHPDQTAALARRIIECLSQPFVIDDQDVVVGTSIGIAFAPEDGDGAGTLLKHADTALYRAKARGRGGHCFFEHGMDLALRERRALERDLRFAIQKKALSLHFQPLFDNSRTLITFEALVRWTHPVRGAVPPDEFIPLAEESGLIVALGEWVLRAACAAALKWDHGYRVAVNLSPVQFLKSDLAATVAKVLAETGLPPSRLELEITEGILISNAEEALQQLTELRRTGVRLVLDDFGTGYSSLSYLHRFPLDKLKVDRSFVQRLEEDSSSRAIVSAIISMSHNLNLEVTAEGVETVEQFDMLCAQGCHELQGFLLGRPIPEGAVGAFLAGLRADTNALVGEAAD